MIPSPASILAREVRARDGRKVLQVRIELGVLQLEVGGRPDGLRPHGFVTYLDYLRHSAANRGQAPGASRRRGRCRPTSAPRPTASSSSFTTAASPGSLWGGTIRPFRTPTTRSP